MAYTKTWTLVFMDEREAMVGMAGVVSDLFAKASGTSCCSSSHPAARRGAARILHGTSSLMRGNGARWSRLGVVEGNAARRAVLGEVGLP